MAKPRSARFFIKFLMCLVILDLLLFVTSSALPNSNNTNNDAIRGPSVTKPSNNPQLSPKTDSRIDVMTDRLDNLEKTFKKQLAIQVAKNQIFEQEIAVLKIKLSDDDDLNEEDGERNEVRSFFQHKSLQRGKREEKGPETKSCPASKPTAASCIPSKLCSYFQYSDHPDTKIVAYTPSSMCTYLHPDHPDTIMPNVHTTENSGFNATSQTLKDLTSGLILPRSCQDLKKLGYFLNGFYNVKSSDSKSSKIEIVHCNFQQMTSGQNSSGSERRLGVVDVKSLKGSSTGGVMFHVTRLTSFTKYNSTLTFEKNILNIGGGMNIETGIFTAPKPGIYHFAFNGLKDSSMRHLNIDLRRNNEIIARASGTNKVGHFMVTLQATLNLAASDKVELFKYGGAILDKNGGYTQFIGSLLEEDLVW